MLKRICRASNRLPSALEIQVELPTALVPGPVSRTAFSDVYHVQYKGGFVAVKVLRLHADNLARVIKVR